ncbi:MULTISPECIES: hypothetical protein [Pseudomonas]|uniref:hypothetical protein n=1 Tax=Pseudomonas TaxID=286 RepID=UPI0012DFA7FF|nr:MULTISPECIES: hypothetical protein [Pseudomonas]
MSALLLLLLRYRLFRENDGLARDAGLGGKRYRFAGLDFLAFTANFFSECVGKRLKQGCDGFDYLAYNGYCGFQ